MKLSSLIPGSIHSQENRLFTLRSPLPEAGLILDRFSGTESVSAPFLFTLNLLSEKGNLELRDLLGKPLGVALRTASGAGRPFHGHVTAFRHTGTDGGFARYEATLAPWTEFLDHRFNCKLFQNKTVPDILREVFGAYGHLARFELNLKDADYPPLTFCAQYQESDFRFVSRLLEAHGIHYHFRFEEDGHILVLSDDSRIAPRLPGLPRIAYNTIPGAAREDTIDAWDVALRVVPTSCSAKSFDFKSPRDPMNASEKTALPTGPLPQMEDYRYAGAYGYPDFQAGGRLVRRRLEVHEARAETFSGRSNCRLLTCGHAFEFLNHYRQGKSVHDRTYYLTSVTHEGSNNHLDHASPADYRNTFTCVPKLTPFRPALATPRPLIHGPQTATVVGPEGEEIYCDRYGRVLIQLHWDRLGEFNDASSCWVRVSAPWAGARFGMIAVPRIGQEVIVEFLDGDPDRPIITGSVYNEVRMPPWELPANRTQTGILTRSSKEGAYDNANALRFEDRKGAEEVWLHAEKDQRIEVENDETTDVGHDRTETVGNDETITIGQNRKELVGANETITIARNRTESVGVNEIVTIGASQSLHVGATQKVTVGATQSIDVGATKTETVLLASMEQVGGVRTLTVGEAYLITVAAGKNEAVGLESLEEVGHGKTTNVGTAYTITAGDLLEIRVGKSSLLMDKEGKITLSGIEVNIEGEGPVKVLGKNVKIN